MPTENGYSNQKKKGTAQFKTIHDLGSSRQGTAVTTKALYDITIPAGLVSISPVIGSNGQIEFYNLEITAHGLSSNNLGVVKFTSGALSGWEIPVERVIDVDNIYVLPVFDTVPSPADLVKSMGWVTSKADSDGNLNFSPGPTQFILDGVSEQVTQDTVTPANNQALPSIPFFIQDGVQIPVSIDTVTPTNSTPLPVEIFSMSGPINVTAGDLNVQLSDIGPNFDATRLGDGSGNYVGVNASAELLVKDVDTGQALIDLTSTHEAVAKATGIQILGERIDNATLEVAPSRGAEGDSLRILTDNLGQARVFDQFSYDELVQFRANFLARIPANLTVTSNRLQVDGSGVVQPISAASLPLPTGAATEAKQDTGNTSLSSIDTKLTSQATAANQAALATLVGSTTEIPPATDTDPSGLNGRLQRIAQRITSLIALLPTSLGQKTSTSSLAVVLASDQSAISVAPTALTASYQEDLTVTDAAAETFTAPAGAKWCKIQADDTNTGNMRVKIGGTATTTSGIQFQPGRSEDYQAVGNISYIMEAGFTGKIYVQFGA